MSRRVFLGLDVGGTYAKLAAVSSSGRVLARSSVPTLIPRGPRAFVERAADEARRMAAGLVARWSRAGLGIAGDVDAERGRIRCSPNLKTFEGFPVRDALRRALGVPVAMQNDANMAAWGCYSAELGRRSPNVLCVTLGTGVGGGIVLGGRLHSGSTGSAGEVGHMRVEPGGARCACGERGCLEAYAGSYGILRLARAEMGRRARGLDARGVAEAARRGDAGARRTWRRVGDALGTGVVNLVYLLNPDAVVFVGGISGAGSLFLDPVRRALRAQPFKTPCRHARVLVAETPEIGALGAALYALEGGG